MTGGCTGTKANFVLFPLQFYLPGTGRLLCRIAASPSMERARALPGEVGLHLDAPVSRVARPPRGSGCPAALSGGAASLDGKKIGTNAPEAGKFIEDEEAEGWEYRAWLTEGDERIGNGP